MKKINELLDNLNISSFDVKKEEKRQSANLNPHVVEIINNLFGMFWALCPGFEKQFNDPKKLNMAKTQWTLAFQDLNLDTLEKINTGIKKCRIESPINIPTIGQFIDWCKPSHQDLNLLPKEQALRAAYAILADNLKKELSDIQLLILKHTIQETGSFFMKNNISSVVEPVFYRNYEISIRDYLEGNLKEIPKAIEDNVDYAPVDPKFAEFNSREIAIDKLRELLR